MKTMNEVAINIAENNEQVTELIKAIATVAEKHIDFSNKTHKEVMEVACESANAFMKKQKELIEHIIENGDKGNIISMLDKMDDILNHQARSIIGACYVICNRGLDIDIREILNDEIAFLVSIASVPFESEEQLDKNNKLEKLAFYLVVKSYTEDKGADEDFTTWLKSCYNDITELLEMSEEEQEE